MSLVIGALFFCIVAGLIIKGVRSNKRQTPNKRQTLHKSNTSDSSATTSTPFFFAGSDSDHSHDCGSSFGGDSGSSGGDGGSCGGD